MCIEIHSDGHLDVLLLYEQICPEIGEGSVHITECYDVVFRSYGTEELKCLYVLSPRRAINSRAEDQDTFVPLQTCDMERFDWLFEQIKIEGNGSQTSVIRPLATFGQESPTFRTTALRPIVRELDQISSADLRANMRQDGVTMARVEFAAGARIEQYDPQRKEETTYWLRLAYRTRLEQYVISQQRFPLGNPQYSLDLLPCELVGPSVILGSLIGEPRFEGPQVLSSSRSRAAAARDAVLNIFHRSGTSTRIDDHRISLVTSEDFLVLNTRQHGDCMFAGVYRVEGLPGKTVRTWLTGARLFPESDALMFARAVYDYLKNWAYGAIEAKTVDQISSAVSPGNRENLAHVLDRLHSLGFVRSPHPGYYCVEGPVATESEFLLTKPTGTGEEPFGTHENHIRTCLYGDVPSGSPSQASPRFKPRSYRIGFDLAVGSWHANTSVSLGRKVDNGHTGIDGGGDSISSTDYSTNGKGVFIVHGRNHTVRDAIALFIANDLGLPIKMMEAGANEGRTLPEKFEDMAEQCAFAVFLLTADDNLIYTADNRLVKRARQNVILEIGYFWAALGRRNRVAFLVENCPDMELPSDLQGIGLIPIKEDLGETKICLQKELRAAGLI